MSSPWVIANRFQISDPGRDLLARGGIGDVYRGTDLQTGQLVAIKALQPHIVASDADVVARFMREGQTLRVLDHPNIVKIVDAVRDEGRHYLAMEYVGGGSLRNLLDQRGALPIRRTLEIALDLSDALTRAHRFGVIHGDIKPSNVLLAEDGTPRLTDFGVAQFIDGAGLPHVGLLVGTVDYLSPEAYSGEPLDARADIWSFGVMLYEMLTGDRPFRGESVHSAITSIFTQPVPALLQACTLALEDIGQEECDDVPSALADLIYRMLEKDRDARIPSVRLVGAELEAILAEINGQSLAATHHVSLATRFARSLPPSVSLKHSLPTQSTRFVGRERDLAELDVLLARPEVRLVSILGPGGAGKTRLAIEVASRQLGRFADGAYLVPLAFQGSSAGVLPNITEVLGLPFTGVGSLEERLQDHLRSKRVLLILDACEHCTDRAEFLEGLLQAAPGVKVLVTLRLALNVPGEHPYPIAGLDLPDPAPSRDPLGSGAIRLYLQAARRVRPGFGVDTGDLGHIVRICHLVQGMPLGILLAAAWMQALPPAKVRVELEQRFDRLATEPPGAPGPERGIRGAFDLTWDWLTSREQRVLQGLSSLRSGFTRREAQEAADASLYDLMSLVSRSLLYRTPEGQYQVHRLLGQYAEDKLVHSLSSEAGRGQTALSDGAPSSL